MLKTVGTRRGRRALLGLESPKVIAAEFIDENLPAQEDDRGKRLVLGGCAHATISGQVRKEPLERPQRPIRPACATSPVRG